MSRLALGISIGHDRSAAVVKDGVLLGVTAQERLDRIKHSNSSFLAFECIDKLLNYLQISIHDIDCIGFSGSELDEDFYAKYLLQNFYSHYNCGHKPVYLVRHHQSHAEAVYEASPFDHALILIADGGGDYIGNQAEAESLFIGKGSDVTFIKGRYQSPIIRHMSNDCNYLYPRMPKVIQDRQLSISRKYEQITYLLGFGWGEAGKTMGLASYGKSLLSYPPSADADFGYQLNAKDILNDLYLLEMQSGQSHFQYLKDNSANIAQTVQTYTEDIIIHLIDSLIDRYHERNICLGGGLFLNCMLNKKILAKCKVEEIFVFPACGDDGQAVGNAFYAYKKHFGSTDFHISLPYLGLSYSNQEIEHEIQKKGLSYTYYSDEELVIKTAEFITGEKIVGLHRGRTEIGPRALCHRSILANPANPLMKDILNNKVKHREYFRPFAPVVTLESLHEIFDIEQDSPYMLLAADVKQEFRDKIPAVTHVDGTARVQSVSAQQEPFIHALLLELRKRIGVPVVLNTSFNVAGEPIVETPGDAIQTFLKTEIDILIIGNYVIIK